MLLAKIFCLCTAVPALLASEVHADKLQDSEAQALLAENEGLKAELMQLEDQVGIMERRQQSMEELMMKCMAKLGLDAEEPGSVPHPNIQHKKNSDASSDHDSGPSLVGPDYSQHLQSPRSDDQGPLQTLVDHLSQRIIQLTADVQALQTFERDIQATKGSSFVHWGSSSCPASSQLVYTGVAGGSLYSHSGAAANFLCLTMLPIFRSLASGRSYTLLYGAEYETSDSDMNKDPVCAVCHSTYSSTIMIPGTTVCTSGWTLQYSGYLMSGHYSHSGASQFICVDTRLESEPGSNDNHDGHLLYYTKTVCGSLPCSPYINNREVTCAVCSK